jgi:ribonucleoside-diphosphate reductase alpha chain
MDSMVTPSPAIRRRLHERRRAETFDLLFRNQMITVTAGFFADGTLGEVFINIGKSGTDIQSVARDAGVLLSLALQHGVAPEMIRHAVTRGASEEPALLGAVIDYISTNLSSPKGDI